MTMEHTLLDLISLIIGVVSMLFIMLTMLLRGNDYLRKAVVIDHIVIIRIFGFITTGFTPAGVIGFWWFTGGWPSIIMALFLLGVSAIFFTSENVPPWWQLLTKGSTRGVRHDR